MPQPLPPPLPHSRFRSRICSGTDVIKVQLSKAHSPRLVRPAGSAIDANEEQPEKARTPMLVRLAGSSIDVIEEQP